MRFKVVGANAESGDDVDVMLEAPTQPDVEKLAHEQGILVSSITAAPAVVHAAHDDAEPIALVEDAPSTTSTHPNHQSGAIAVNTGAPAAASNGSGASHAPAASPAPAAAASAAPGAAHGHGDAQMEYHVLINQSLYLLETAVNRHIKEGWEPTGGLTVGISNNAMQFFQAVIRRKNKPAA